MVRFFLPPASSSPLPYYRCCGQQWVRYRELWMQRATPGPELYIEDAVGHAMPRLCPTQHMPERMPQWMPEKKNKMPDTLSQYTHLYILIYPRWHFPFKMVGLGPPINQILCVFFAVGALHFVERDLFIHTQHHFIWEQDHMPVSGTSIL